MPSLDDYAGIQPEGAALGSEAAAPEAEVHERPRFQIPEFLKARTGAGSVESYLDHPLNYGRNIHLARILRGLTGMFNELNYAVFDIFIGALGFTKKKQPIDLPPHPGAQL